MRKSVAKYLLVAIAASLAACNEGTIAPTAQSSNVANNIGSLATLTYDTTRFSFTVNNATGGSFYLGAGNSVRFPAGSMCDPSSSYGDTQWDVACTPASAPVTVNAKAWLDATNHPHVDFTNHLRFVPTSDPTQYVTIVFTDTSASQSPASNILYCAYTYAQCVNELSGDASLVTVKNPVTHVVTRRIKHFSGYVVTVGDGGCPPDNPDCTEGGAGFSKAKGSLSPNTASSASATIGVEGGTIELSDAGLSVTIPAGALSAPTNLSIAARPGALLAYEFQPHGLQFAQPVLVTQTLAGTGLEDASYTSLRAVYFADEAQVDDVSGGVLPSETMNVEIDRMAGTAAFAVRHFSGYIFATGSECTSQCASDPVSPRDGGVSFVRVAGTPRLAGVLRAAKSRSN